MDKKSPVRNIISVIIGVLLGLSLLIGIFWVPIQKVLMQPEAYKQAFQDQDIYRVFPQIIGGVLSGDSSSNLFGDGFGQLTSKLDQDLLNEFFISLVPPESIQEQVESNLDSLFGFLHGTDDTLSLGVDLIGFKNNLSQENSVRGVIQMLPVCTTADLAALLSLLGGEKNLPLCRFPDEVMGLVFPIIQPFILNMVAQIPDDIPLITISLHSPNTPPGLVTFVYLVRNSNTISGILVGINILLFTALILVSTPGWKIKIRNCGIVFLAAGTAGLVFGFILWMGINSGTAGMITYATSAIPVGIGEVITEIYLQIANSFVMVASLAGFIVLTIGVIFFVISRTVLKNQSDY